MEKFNQLKTKLIFGGIALILLAVIIWYAWYKGKNSTVIAPPVKDSPNSTDPNNNPAGISETDVKQIATDIYNEISGYNYSGHDPAPYERLLSLSDTDFVRVYNSYNTQYQQQSGSTLEKQVQGEWVLYDPAWDALQASMMDRFSKLNLI